MAKKNLGKRKIPAFDGLGPKEKAKIRNALRLVWRNSHARKLVEKRCKIGKTEYSRCEQCKKRVPKIYVNHIKTVGEVDDGFIRRMFVSSKEMEGICKKCHDPITAQERKEAAKKRKAEKQKNEDFY